MLIFVSDLHLVDHASRASFKPAPMFEAIRSRLKDSNSTKDPVTLVLLGDIFELLKSHVWFEDGVRPWDEPSDKLNSAAHRVLQGIVKEPGNEVFFEQLKALQNEFKINLEYLPGNHDGLLADEKVKGLREALRQSIPGLGNGDGLFEPILVDEHHGVVAEHGHQLDSFNRLHVKSGRFVPGDAVVIELLVGLPRKVREIRNAASEFIQEFEFLHEMDNVEPQSLTGLMRWLEFRLKDVGPLEKNSWEVSVSEALRHCIQQLRLAMKAHNSQPLARKVLWTFHFHQLLTRVSVLRNLARVPSVATNEFSQVAKRVSLIAPSTRNWKAPPDLFIAGHTHSPLQQVFATAKGDQMTYLNTGTWRRVHSPVSKLGKVAFREAYHEALVCVHRRSLAAQNGRYELRRYVRGS